MMASILALAASLSTYHAPDRATLEALVKVYVDDSDASNFLCETDRCEVATVIERTDRRCASASIDMLVCFIEPKAKAKNFYTGVVAKAAGADPVPQFVFFGSGIDLGKSFHDGVQDVSGREIGEDGAVIEYTFCWSGRRYTETCESKPSR